ncbi:hypothetical protein GCG21_08835 [Pseudactinotalea sp. HY160]|uniref:hypothetical protein n=1 Tax=Pseudactinotalea sp. HY160 TaxID=2654490 RepID=UPI00128C992A|nr:hypothetical protein [Pseudactinotalea sp. HY160]MPV50110.1 hypothetical protein [Pseudactinotalea sp. HY160]
MSEHTNFEVGERIIVTRPTASGIVASHATITRATKTLWIVERAGREEKFSKSTLAQYPAPSVWQSPEEMHKADDPAAIRAVEATVARHYAGEAVRAAEEMRDEVARGHYGIDTLALVGRVQLALARCARSVGNLDADQRSGEPSGAGQPSAEEASPEQSSAEEVSAADQGDEDTRS